MATRWGASAGELSATPAPAGLGLSCQPSAAAVNAAHAEITAFTTALAGVMALSGLSALLARPTEHLTEAAGYWESIGERCYGVANQVWRDALSVDWQGATADAPRNAKHADMLTTSEVADQLHEAAKVARSGASDLYAARSRIRYAVRDARTARFPTWLNLVRTINRLHRTVAIVTRFAAPGVHPMCPAVSDNRLTCGVAHRWVVTVRVSRWR